MIQKIFRLSLAAIFVLTLLVGSFAFAQNNTAIPQPTTTPATGTTSPTNTAIPRPNPTSTAPSSDFQLKIKLNNPLKVNTIQDAIKVFMNAVVKIAIPFIIVFFIWSGLNFILARGNPEKLKVAKNMFWYTIIGTLLILGAWAITNAIVGTINSIAA